MKSEGYLANGVRYHFSPRQNLGRGQGSVIGHVRTSMPRRATGLTSERVSRHPAERQRCRSIAFVAALVSVRR